MKSISEYINEGLFSAFKASAQLTKAQGAVFDYFEQHADEYADINSIRRDLEDVAEKAYKEHVTEPGAIKFKDWFKGFEKSFMEYAKRNK